MPHARPLGALALLLVLLPACAGAQEAAGFDWSPEFRGGLAWQDYADGELEERILARTLELRLVGRHPAGWSLDLGLLGGDDLYLGNRRAQLSAGFLGDELELSLHGSLERYLAGGLSEPLLYFDPDSLESEAAESTDYLLSTGGLGFGWHGQSWDARTEFDLRELDYEDESEILSDLREAKGSGRLGLGLPAGLRGELELGASLLRYPGRPGSDRDSGRLGVRLARDLSAGEIALAAEREEQRPLRPEEVAYYERPRGHEWALVAEVLHFRDRSDWLLTLRLEREDWDYLRDQYFRSGDGLELELSAGLRLGDGSSLAAPSLDLFLLAGRFDPDSIPDADALARGGERRLEGSARLALNPAGRFPVSLMLTAEQLKLSATSEDRYMLLQQTLELSWRARPGLTLRGELGVDHYGSRYGDAIAGEEDSESELGLNGGLTLLWERGSWEWRLGFARRVYTSFLDLGGESRDREGGLWIRWRP